MQCSTHLTKEQIDKVISMNPDTDPSIIVKEANAAYYDRIKNKSVLNRSNSSDTLFNFSDVDSTVLHELISGKELFKGDVNTIITQLNKLDRESAYYDEDHSKYLHDVLSQFQSTVKELRSYSVNVTKDFIEGLTEPVGEHSKNKISIATAKGIASSILNLTNEETLVHEYTHAFTSVVFNKELGIYATDIKNQLRSLYETAKDNLTYKDLLDGISNHSSTDVQLAKRMYDYIFNGNILDYSIQDANARYAEFLAYAMTNKQFKKALSKIEAYPNETDIMDNNVKSTLYKLFMRVVNFVNNITNKKFKVSKDKTATVDLEVGRLLLEIGKINQKYGYKAVETINEPLDQRVSKTVINNLEKLDNKLFKFTTKSTEKFFNSIDINVSPDDKEQFAKVAKKLNNNINKLRKDITSKDLSLFKKSYAYADIIYNINKLYYLSKKTKNKEFYKKLNEFMHQFDALGLHYLTDVIKDFKTGSSTFVEISDKAMQFKTHLDRVRDIYYKGTLKFLLEEFKHFDMKHNRNIEYNKVLDRVILRTDIQSVTTSVNELKKLLSNADYRRNKIASIEDELKTAIATTLLDEITIGDGIVNDCKSLASYMTTGVGHRTNAVNIARRFGSFNVITSDEFPNIQEAYNINDIVKKIDKLTSLYALDNNTEKDFKMMLDLIAKDRNGVEKFINTAFGAAVAHYEDFYTADNLHNLVKGQGHIRYDRDKELIFAPLSDLTELKNAGYHFVRKMKQDSMDTDDTPYGVFYTTDRMSNKRVDGTLGLQQLKVHGLLLSQKIMYSNPHLTGKKLGDRITTAIAEARYSKSGLYEHMYPVYNSEGEIIDFRYEFPINEREELQGIEVRGIENLSRSIGQKESQLRTNTHNREIIDIILEDTDKHVDEPDYEFLVLHAPEKIITPEGKVVDNGARTEGEELWGLLPDDAKNYIIDINKSSDNKYGKNGTYRHIKIRKELLTQLFGYDEPSITELPIFKKISMKRVKQFKTIERYWIDLISIAKSNVVVKTLETQWNNIMSNAKFFFFSGVPPRDAGRYLASSKLYLEDWKKLERNIRLLEIRADSEKTSSRKHSIEKRIAMLKAKQNDNPLMPLFDAGLYQVISEDIDVEEDNNTITKAITSKFDNLLSKNTTLESVINTIFLTRKSTAGKILIHTMQESDFHFRAAIYLHGIANGKTKKEMLRKVTDNFINYSKVTSSRFIRYLNNTAPEAFWTYFANIQRVNWDLIKEKPVRVIIDTLGKNFTDYVPTDTLDSSFISELGKRANPVYWVTNTSNLFVRSFDIPILHVLRGF